MVARNKFRIKSVLNKNRAITKKIDFEVAETIKTVDKLEREIQELHHQIRLLL
jgi:hypothetical protein